MEWVWELYKNHVDQQLKREGIEGPTAEQREQRFLTCLSESTVTVLVQEEWRNSVRFKGLARYEADEMFDLLNDPECYLVEHFGGGKFKLNFHQGWHFVGTRNFKPDGPPKWKDMEEIEY